ncbi:MAG: type IV pilus secretin PilQ [Myxococcota bacterium]|nr:type IV pilus secretin PilQ [Myxococcota bacterium]
MSRNIARNLRAVGVLITVVGALASVLASADDARNSAFGGAELGADPWAVAPSIDVAAVQSETLDSALEGGPVALQSGTVLMAVNVEPSFEGALIHFHADGELALARTFALEEPPRLVIDFPGIRGDLPSRDIVLGGDFVSAIRVGVHPGKLRVVIDGAAGPGTFDGYRAVPSMDGLYLAVGAGPELDLRLESRLGGAGYSSLTLNSIEADDSGAEPILLAMTGTEDETSLEDLWRTLGEDPEVEAIEAALLAEVYALDEPAPAPDALVGVEVASATPLADLWDRQAAASGGPEAVLVVESPVEAPLAEARLEEALIEELTLEETIREDAIFEEAVRSETASEDGFWARAGKPVEIKIADLELADPPGGEAATPVPATGVLATGVSATEIPATGVPAQGVPATEVPATGVPATGVPGTLVPATGVPAMGVPATALPTSAVPATAKPVQIAMVSGAAAAPTEPAWDPWALDSEPASVAPTKTVSADPVKVASAASTKAPTATTAPTPTPAPVPVAKPGAPTEIFGLQFDRDSQRDRVAILGDRIADYEVFEPDSQTLIILLKRSLLSEGMSERITPEIGGPLSQVTIFQQPDIQGDEVRVVLRRADGLKPKIYQRGSLLLADFANTGEAAALPVALIPAQAVPDASAELAETAEAVEAREARVEAVVTAAQAGDIVDPENPKDTISVAPELINAEGDRTYGNEAPDNASSSAAPGGNRYVQEFSGSPISLDFKDVPIMDVLRLIAEVSELNIIAGDEVKGAITLRLVEVPWDQALDIILVTRGLGYVRVGNVLRIAPAEALQAEEAERLQDRRNREQLEDLEVKLQPVNYAAVEDVSTLVRRLLSPRGTVNTDKRTNTVIIKDIPSVIAEATALIEALDTQTPQVMIEAKIVEAALDFGRELGTIWGVGTNPDSGAISTGGVTWDGKNNVAFNNGISSLPTGAASMGFLLLDDNIRVDVAVEAMEEAGEGKVISSPRVVTLDNREALIEQGVSIPFQTFEGGDAKLEFVDAVLSLKVTPHITPDESIIMSLEVTRNAPDSGVSTPTGSPAIAKNQAKTETLVKNGQTLVIGGIYTIDKSTTESRVPYLYKIPVLGAAFKSRRVSDVRKELLIFITPRIVVNPALADN